MKTLKLAIAALLLAFTFQAASAQVRVGVQLGGRPAPRRVVVVNHHRHHYYHRHHVVVRRHY
jgi:hypothetical protein